MDNETPANAPKRKTSPLPATRRALFTVAEAAEACGITENAMRHWIRNKSVPENAVVRINNRVRVKAWWLNSFHQEAS